MFPRVTMALFAAITPALAVEIQLDYGHDEDAHDFFRTHPDAKSAIEKAADDLGAVLSHSLDQITDSLYEGNNNGTKAYFNWSWSYINPVTGATESISNPNVQDDTIIIHVGTRNISVNSTLGQGGIGGAGVAISTDSSYHPANWAGAVALAETASNTAMGRNGGPIVNTISGSAGGASYDLSYGVSVSNIWFDADTDNDGLRDSDSKLRDYWHFDVTSPVAAGKFDLYSVALHEMLHALGAGTSETWRQLSNGNHWLGSAAVAQQGTSHILDLDGFHSLSGTYSPRQSDGVLQESVIAPTMTPGVRKELTELDIAFLEDLGYNVNYTPVPEPSSFAMLGLGFLGLLRRSKQ